MQVAIVHEERRANIPRSMLDRVIVQYDDNTITRADIFHYVYAVLHHPGYPTRYAENLKRELPRIPFAPDFRSFAKAGAKLAEMHVFYEKQKEYQLRRIENKDTPLDWRVEAMKLSKEGDALVYNEHFTFAGIPPEVTPCEAFLYIGTSVTPALLRLDPAWDPLRSDPASKNCARKRSRETFADNSAAAAKCPRSTALSGCIRIKKRQ